MEKDWIRVAIFNIAFFSKIVLPSSRCIFLETAFPCLSTIIILRALIVRPVQGDYWDALIFISGITFLGLSYGLDFSIRHNDTKMWPSRILIAFFGFVLVAFVILLCNFYRKRQILAKWVGSICHSPLGCSLLWSRSLFYSQFYLQLF